MEKTSYKWKNKRILLWITLHWFIKNFPTKLLRNALINGKDLKKINENFPMRVDNFRNILYKRVKKDYEIFVISIYVTILYFFNKSKRFFIFESWKFDLDFLN